MTHKLKYTYAYDHLRSLVSDVRAEVELIGEPPLVFAQLDTRYSRFADVRSLQCYR